jgi:hypothetical protein
MVDLDANKAGCDAGQAPGDCDEAGAANWEFVAFLQQLGPSAMTEWLDLLVSRFDSARFVAADYSATLAVAIRAIIEKRRPASLIRLGDGEGNVLAATDEQFPALTREANARIANLMFGVRMGEAMKSLSPLMTEAVANADVLGVPCGNRIEAVGQKIRTQLSKGEYDLRGMSGAINALRHAARILGEAPVDGPRVITNCYFHRDLLPHYGAILADLPCMGLISCHAGLPERLRRGFGIGEVDFYEIPPQALSLGRAPDRPHYPERFEQLMSSITVGFDGQVFLVAAGILGKIYCERIRHLGGIGFDLGSTADVWMGQSAREYQTEDFVNRWKL